MEKIEDISDNTNHEELLSKVLDLFKDLEEVFFTPTTDIFCLEEYGIKNNSLVKNFMLDAEKYLFEKKDLYKLKNLSNENSISSRIKLLNDIMNDKLILREDIQFEKSMNHYKKFGNMCKKSYEVEVLAKYILKYSSLQTCFLELGCGKSYLYSEIKDQIKDKIDSLKFFGVDKKEHVLTDSQYPVFNMMVDSNNFIDIYNKIKIDNEGRFCLLGLHACGDLTSNSIKIFIENKQVTDLIIVGCCLNLITEDISHLKDNASYNKYISSLGKNKNGGSLDSTLVNQSAGFPLSSYLKKQNLFLGRMVRNSAMQSEKFFDEEDFEKNLRKMYFRCLFQVYLETYLPHYRYEYGLVGKIKLNSFDSIEEYFSKIKNIQVQQNLNKLGEFKERFDTKENYLLLFSVYYLKIKFAKLIEIIVSLDRVIYMKERGISNVCIVKIFNEFSDRNILIKASKN